MSEQEDRSPLILKVALRQALWRLQGEISALSQLGTLSGNLGWEEVAGALDRARAGLEKASGELQDAVEAAVRVQAASSHAHSHPHSHVHTHAHSHPHDHEHPGEEAEHAHEHEPAHLHDHLHEHPHVHGHPEA